MRLLTITLILFFGTGCYTFSGVSIDPGTSTYYVAPFEVSATSVEATYPVTIAEDIREKIRTQSRLIFTDTNPDVEFKGTVTGFNVTSEAPRAGEEISFNRLTISLDVEFIDHRDEEKNWRNRFSFFSDFSADDNIIDVQEQLIAEINEQLVENIFNKAFANW